MKKVEYIIIGLIIILTGCNEKDSYDFSKVIPGKTEIHGSSSILTGIGGVYTALIRGGSTYEWYAAEGSGDVSFTPVDDKPYAIFINSDSEFDTVAFIVAVETTMGGIRGIPDTMQISIQRYCPLINGISDFVGSWYGIDADYSVGVDLSIVTEIIDDTLYMTGLGFGWLIDFWGEEIIDGGTLVLEVNADNGEVVIPEQTYFTTIYEDEEQEPYTISGKGKWNNCGSKPVLILEYDLSNYDESWGTWMFENGYSVTDKFVAIIELK
ncbi:MAG: hypothetical protein JW717_11095 [Marinilabiliaceae bacterium]|nr:hypothetical protein [Marinilabiliaceae bacterium]